MPHILDSPVTTGVRALADLEPGGTGAGPGRTASVLTVPTVPKVPTVPTVPPVSPATGTPARPVVTGDVPDHALRAAHGLLRTALEVIDRRRPPAAARSTFTAPLVDVLASLAAADLPARRLGPARVRRVHVHRATDREYEVCASYTRGARTFAVAARISADGTRARCEAIRLA